MYDSVTDFLRETSDKTSSNSKWNQGNKIILVKKIVEKENKSQNEENTITEIKYNDQQIRNKYWIFYLKSLNNVQMVRQSPYDGFILFSHFPVLVPNTRVILASILLLLIWKRVYSKNPFHGRFNIWPFLLVLFFLSWFHYYYKSAQNNAVSQYLYQFGH